MKRVLYSLLLLALLAACAPAPPAPVADELAPIFAPPLLLVVVDADAVVVPSPVALSAPVVPLVLPELTASVESVA